MITSQDPDPGSGNSLIGRWTYLAVKNGASYRGFLAGKPVGVWVHYTGGSKPCRKRMTNHKIACPYCADSIQPVWRGYTPIYTGEYVQMFVLISAEYLESVREIAPNAQVSITRGKGSREPVLVQAQTWRVTPLPPSSSRSWPVDLMPYLLRNVWKDADLLNYSDAQPAVLPGVEPVEVVAPGGGDKLSPEDTMTMSKAVIRRNFIVKVVDQPTKLEDVLPNLAARLNGKHRK